MMEFKGTKGPWEISAQADAKTIARIDIGNNKDIRIDASSNVTLEEEQANAKLIAAAPELLEALQRLIIAAKPHCVPTSQLNMRVTEAEGIINKALHP